ncbi:MAG: polysaccharide pyruvyl transferase CsaB [Defluviitaleaceae bacterium]|nr:polysaccharide pyruvyl transferase CsaB [Defluviitaleaceae bacterium]
MKVLHLISGGDKGGAKTHVFTLLLALQQEIDVTVVCVMDGVFYQEIQNMPIKSILMKQKYRNDLTIIVPLVSHIRKERYNLVHVHGARANFIAMFLRLFIKIPIVTTVHSDYKLDFTDSPYKKYVYTGLNILALKFVDYYVAVSENFKEMLITRGFNEDKIYTVYNTIDFETPQNFQQKEDFLKQYNIQAESKTLVGIIGRFDQVKGHSVFINAAAQVLKANPNVVFLLAGEGPEESSLRQQAKKLKIEKNVIFTGFIEDIFSFINAIDINVLSSYSESFPYVLLEGALLKKATVSTAVGGVTDLIQEEKTGLLAPAGDYIALGQKIIALINDKNLQKDLGENLYSFAKDKFSKESMKQRHLEIYHNIIALEKMHNRSFDVALSGYYGFDNSGDDALLKAVIDNLRKEKDDIKILVLSKKPTQTMEEHGVYSINRHDFFAILKYMKRCRLFVYGGGSLIQDITSTKSLVYYTTLLRLAKKYGLKLMVYGNGIGPIAKEKNIKRAKHALNLCDYISLREPASFMELERLGVKTPQRVLSVDPAFAIEPLSTKEILKTEGIDETKTYFGVSCRSWKYNEPNFTEKIAKVIKQKATIHKMTPIYIAMHPNDYNILKEIISKADTPHILLSCVYDVQSLMGIIQHTRFVMSMRLHTLVYAVSVGVPVIGLTYDPKVRFFIEYAKQNTYVDTSDLDEKALGDMIDHILEEHEQIAAAIKIEAAKLKALSQKDAKVAVELI